MVELIRLAILDMPANQRPKPARSTPRSLRAANR
jgi:hypothetical protein